MAHRLADAKMLLCGYREELTGSKGQTRLYTLMVKILTISVAVASFLAVPALCVGGVITHACECDSGCPCTGEADCGHEAGCGHEGGCPDDPCSIGVLRPERHGNDIVTPSHPAASTAIIPAAERQSWAKSVCARVFELPCAGTLPFPPSDHPLLI